MGLNVSDTVYSLVLLSPNGGMWDVSDFTTDLGWEENDGEWAMRMSCTFGTDDAKLRSLIKLGAMMAVIYNGHEVARGFIQEAEQTLSNPTDSIKITCYDEMIYMEKSEEQYYFKAGQSTKKVLTQIFSGAGIPMGKYTGANVTHAKMAYKSGSMADTVKDVLEDAKKKGGVESLVRMKEGKAEVIQWGYNDEIYQFDPDDTVSVSYKMDITNLVTRVKVIGKKESETARPIAGAVTDGLTQFGIRQKIVQKSKSANTGQSQTEASQVLKEKGKPETTTTVQSPDVPTMRKGDKVYLKFGTVTGYYYVKGIKHDAMNGTMTLDLKPVA